MANPFDQFDSASGNPFDQFDAPKRDPKIGQPEELSWTERNLAPLLDKIGLGDVAGGNVRGSAVGRLAMGAADPGISLLQLGANLTGNGADVNQAISDTNKKYEAARAEAGSTGFDPLRAAGGIAMTAMIPGAMSAGSGVVRGAISGAGSALLDPVRDAGDNFAAQKLKQIAIGAAGGAVLSPLMGALARVISPNASTNEANKLLESEGIQQSVGQALGGAANRLEQKLTSVPVLGDFIGSMRNRAIDQFNEAAINRSVAPIGQRVEGVGQDAVAEAGDKLSKAYQDALAGVNHVNFDTPAFNAKFGQLQQMVEAPGGLTPALADKFNRILKDEVLRRMSPNGSIAGTDLKTVDSALGKLAAKWQRSSTTSETELGDALLQLKTILSDEVRNAVPDVAAKLKAADTGWANLVRVEGAAGRAVNSGGRFTPGQLNGAVKAADRSVRDRATARGEALMQDLANAGSRLGNHVPDSGTVGRALVAGSGLMAGLLHPAIPSSIAAGSVAYTPPIQNLLRYLLTQRPDIAPAVADYVRQLTAPAAMAGGGLLGSR